MGQTIEIGQGVWVLNQKIRFRLGVRRRFFTVRMAEHWVAQGGGGYPILETFSARLDEALSILIYWKISLLTALD